MTFRTYTRFHHLLRLEVRTEEPLVGWSLLRILETQSRLVIIVCAYLLVGVVAVVEYLTGPELSCSLFYLIPISLVAWWGGFAHGILLALSSTLAWHALDLYDAPGIHPAIRLWNAILRFGFFAFTTGLLARLRTALLQEQALARTDALTGVANGRTFYETARLEIQRFCRTARPFTAAYLDLDDFKAVNDQRGHAAGDELLRQVATTLRKHTRAFDTVARLGGDEFALLLPETDPAEAARTLEKLRGMLRQELDREGWSITFSVGAATFLQAPRDVDDMLQRVDTLMYQVKRTGKDQVLHETLSNHNPTAAGAGNTRSDRRASVRLLCDQIAHVTCEDTHGKREWVARVRDISTLGIALHLDCELPPQTLLTIEALCRGRGKTLLARVVNARPHPDHGWLHGCELSTRLSEEEIRDWQV
jgi:diguanylate cyclase (GGDEF)-like protein